MNTTQRRILLAGLALLVVLVLLPPWQRAATDISGGYSLIFWPPTREIPSPVPGFDPYRVSDFRIAPVQWIVPMLVVVLGAGVLFALAKKPVSRPECRDEFSTAFREKR